MSEKCEFIDVEKATVTETGEKKYTIVKMWGWLDVSTSGYYEWHDRPDSATAQRRQVLTLLVTTAFEDSSETYGHRRVHAQLARWDTRCSPEPVRGIMREQGLVPCQPRRWRHNLTESDPSRRPDPRPRVPGLHRHRHRPENGGRYHVLCSACGYVQFGGVSMCADQRWLGFRLAGGRRSCA
ncbi:MAG: IS3 family transposase [Pseudonocardiaceae bacterium]